MNTKIIDLDPVEYQWKSDDMNMATGCTAQETGSIVINVADIDIDLTSAATSYTFTDTISSDTFTISNPYQEMEERLAKLEKIIAEEAELRAQHPAVKQAYDEYKLLATLAKTHTGDLTDE